MAKFKLDELGARWDEKRDEVLAWLAKAYELLVYIVEGRKVD